MEKEEARTYLSKYMQKQKDVAKDLAVSKIYLNQFLNGFNGVSGRFLSKVDIWLAKQK